MKFNAIETLGWYGVLAILSAYALITFRFITTDNLVFQLLNFTGALGIVVDAYKNKNFQPVVLNIVWAIIALIALLKLISF